MKPHNFLNSTDFVRNLPQTTHTRSNFGQTFLWFYFSFNYYYSTLTSSQISSKNDFGKLEIQIFWFLIPYVIRLYKKRKNLLTIFYVCNMYRCTPLKHKISMIYLPSKRQVKKKFLKFSESIVILIFLNLSFISIF